MLGLSQKEIAKLIGVSRSQLSMYEIGKRDLPLEAVKTLGSIVLFCQENKFNRRINRFLEIEHQNVIDWLQLEYNKQNHKRNFLERRKLALENQRLKDFKAFEVLHYLEQFPDNIVFADLVLDIKERLNKNFINNSLNNIMELQLQIETIEMLKSILEEKLKFHKKQLSIKQIDNSK